MDVLEVFDELNELNEDVNSDQVATWFSEFEYLNNVLRNHSLVTSGGRDKESGTWDTRGNHICFSTDHLNPARVLQKYVCGIMFDRQKLEDYCEDNKDKLGLKKVATYDTYDKDEQDQSIEDKFLSRHFDFDKNLAIAKELTGVTKGGGIFVEFIAETIAKQRFMKVLNWERPLQLSASDPDEVALWNALVQAFSIKPDGWVVDSNSADYNVIEDTYTCVYCCKQYPNDLIGMANVVKQKVFPAHCIKLYSARGSDTIHVIIPTDTGDITKLIGANGKLIDDGTEAADTTIKKRLNDVVTQEEEFRLYFNDGVKEFRFPLSVINNILMPSVLFVSHNNDKNRSRWFLDVELAYALHKQGGVFGGNNPGPNKIYDFIEKHLDLYTSGIVISDNESTRRRNFMRAVDAYCDIVGRNGVQRIYDAVRLGFFPLRVIGAVSNDTMKALILAVDGILNMYQELRPVFDTIDDCGLKIKFYHRTWNKDEIASHLAYDTSANDRAGASVRTISKTKDRARYGVNGKNRELNINNKLIK